LGDNKCRKGGVDYWPCYWAGCGGWLSVVAKFPCADCANRANAAGVNLSDLGRFLFGAYIHNLIPSPAVGTSLDIAVQEAEAELRAGKATTIKNKTELKENRS